MVSGGEMNKAGQWGFVVAAVLSMTIAGVLIHVAMVEPMRGFVLRIHIGCVGMFGLACATGSWVRIRPWVVLVLAPIILGFLRWIEHWG